MKLITFTVPSYNSQNYLHKCLDSLVIGGSEVEVIIVNDGSTDDTEKIAREYEFRYPNIVRVISKENGGHGSAINEGLKNATGLYFKVVDSDDWLNEDAYQTFMNTIRMHVNQNTMADLYITNFVYDKVSLNKYFVRTFKKKFKQDTFFTWKNVKHFYGSQVLLMHSLTYNTEKLKQSKIHLPHHTFYVDNLFAYKPLPYMNKMYYMDINLYHYYIGREDQSVNINMFTKRYEQQISVMEEMVKAYSYEEIKNMEKGLSNYMFHCLGAIMTITLLFTVAKDSDERRENLTNMWFFIKNEDIRLYRILRFWSLPTLVNYIPWKLRGWIMLIGYKFLKRRIKLG
ncbi:MAG: glycosyltransferase family A protein [Candidatus Izemoplasmatales bacterium]|nr:glycosyltransferase family A protein [Candidatus Izemoplasmatales bacterium]